MTTLVVAAYAPELAELAELDRLPADVIARAVGIGLIDSAAGTVRALAELRPARVILVGTAGALPQTGYAIGTVCTVVVSTLAVRPCEFVPEPMITLVESDGALVARGRALGLPTADCVSGVGITRDEDEARRLFAGAHLEHLECFSVLRVCAQAGVPAVALLAIANRVGPNAHAEWRANRVAAEAAVQAALLRLL